MREIPILYENDYCMVFDKPAGLAVQGGEGVKTSLDSLLSQKYKPRPLLVHRLDKETSGVILVAKAKDAAKFFSALFAGGEEGKPEKRSAIVKRYLGLCSGIPNAEQGSIAIALDVKGKRESVKESETFYRLISSGDIYGTPFSLLELELGSGRMHQIRRHLAKIGHPLLGDDKYGDFPLNKKLKKAIGLKHLLLHASRLIIPPCEMLPGGLDVSAPLPELWKSFSANCT